MTFKKHEIMILQDNIGYIKSRSDFQDIVSLRQVVQI